MMGGFHPSLYGLGNSYMIQYFKRILTCCNPSLTTIATDLQKNSDKLKNRVQLSVSSYIYSSFASLITTASDFFLIALKFTIVP